MVLTSVSVDLLPFVQAGGPDDKSQGDFGCPSSVLEGGLFLHLSLCAMDYGVRHDGSYPFAAAQSSISAIPC